MSILDREGRLLGRISIVDLLALTLLFSLAPLGTYLHRTFLTGEPDLFEVTPVDGDGASRFESNQGATLTLDGKNFQRDSTVQIGEQFVRQVIYRSPRRLTVVISPGEIPPGFYSLTVTNRHGSLTLQRDRIRVGGGER
ncbi:MAG: IPT/TIG domain-containing protein [Candidatus Omnitrophica bacterium]|nr:IPT/TIG domain-containing protein [Candidatus Omnitrophota bacterium]